MVNTPDKYDLNDDCSVSKAMGTSCCATVNTGKAAASATAVKSCRNLVHVGCVVFLLQECRILSHLISENRDRTLESIHNVKKLSLRFAEILAFLLAALSPLAVKFTMAAFVEAMLAPTSIVAE